MATSDPSAYPRVPPKVAPPDRERPLLLEGMTPFRRLERGHRLKEVLGCGVEVGDASASGELL